MRTSDAVVLAACSPVIVPYCALRLAYNYGSHLVVKRKYGNSLPHLDTPAPLMRLFEPGALEAHMERIRNPDGSFPPFFYYGPHLDLKCVVGVTSPEIMRHIFTHDHDFPKYHMTYEMITDMIGLGLVSMEGDNWKKERKLLTPVFHFDSLTKGVPKIVQVADEKWRTIRDDAVQNGGTVQVKPAQMFSSVTLKIIIAYAFGNQVDNERVHLAFQTLLGCIEDYFLFYGLFGRLTRYLPLSCTRAMVQGRQEITEVIKQSIVDAMHKKKEGLSLNEDNNLLETIISSAKDEDDQETIERAVSEGLTFLFAGHDTTSNLLSFALDYLTRPEYKHFQEELRKEAREAFGEGGVLGADRETSKKLVLCEYVLLETLRLAPPVPLIEREIKKDMEVCGRKLYAGTAVLPFFVCTHRDSRYWDKPDEFDPYRFSPDRAANRQNFTFLPFSAGGRNCIGQKLAILETKLVLASLLLNFQANAVADKPPKWTFTGTMTPHNFSVELVPINK